MKIRLLNVRELSELSTQQLFSIENGLSRGDYNLKEIGELMPASVMVHELDISKPQQVSYMNDWGCENLGHSMDEINEMGEKYYEKFFLPEETSQIMAGIMDYHKQQNYSSSYSFFQQVRTGPKSELSWYYSVCKFLRKDRDDIEPTSMIIVSSSINGIGPMVSKVNKLLEQNTFVTKNYKKFASLTRREKEIITLLTEGKSSPEISDILFISKHTVSKHRRNIVNKLEISSFAELLKFAIAFELIT